MAEQKDVLSLPLVRTPESQLTAEQSLTGRHWNSPKIYPASKDKREAAVRQQEGRNHNKIKSHNRQVGDSQTGEQLYHRSPPTAVKVLSPTSGFPTWGSGQDQILGPILQEEEFLDNQTLKASGI